MEKMTITLPASALKDIDLKEGDSFKGSIHNGKAIITKIGDAITKRKFRKADKTKREQAFDFFKKWAEGDEIKISQEYLDSDPLASAIAEKYYSIPSRNK